MNFEDQKDFQFTQWESMSKSVSTNTIKLVEQRDNTIKVDVAGKYKFIIIPSIIFSAIIALLIVTESAGEFGFRNYVGLLFGVSIFGGVIYFIQNFSFKPSLFDFNNKTYHYKNQQQLNLNEVMGVQILPHHHTVSGNYKIRFEINLIKSNGERLHLYNNSSYRLIEKQADLLSQKLNVEVWDATIG